MKSTIEEIRERFDNDVERFSNLEMGQVAAIDSPLHMELITEAAAATTPFAKRILDIGCGAGNYTIKLLQRLRADADTKLHVTLIDLSRPMLDRAVQRIAEQVDVKVDAIRSDVRDADLGEERFDIILAAQCLHHLRGESEWRDVFARVCAALRPGGSFWISDSVTHESAAVESMIHARWGEYLVSVKDEAYRDTVFAYVEKEDTPRPLQWQLQLMQEVGFAAIDVLHKHGRFASFGGMKRGNNCSRAGRQPT